MDGDDVREAFVAELDEADNASDGEGDADGASAAIDEALAEDRLRAEAKGVGMHAALRHARPGASGGPKAVLADKRAHDLDEDIRRRRAAAELSSKLHDMAYGVESATPSQSFAASGAAAADDVVRGFTPRAATPTGEEEAEEEDDDDDALAAIRRRRLAQMRQAAAAPAGRVGALASKADMGEALEGDRRDASEGMAPRWRVVHLAEGWHAGSRAVQAALVGVAGLCEAASAAGALPAPVAFSSIAAETAIPGLDPDALPAIALYRGGRNADQLLGVLGGEEAASAATVESVAGLLWGAGVPVPAAP